MMIVNGATDPNTIVWESHPIEVTPHIGYFFGAYLTSLYRANSPNFDFFISMDGSLFASRF
jgi:hypothetical protein